MERLQNPVSKRNNVIDLRFVLPHLFVFVLQQVHFCIWVIPCEITQKSTILTPTLFDFGENWWTYSTPWPKLHNFSPGWPLGSDLEVIIGHDFFRTLRQLNGHIFCYKALRRLQ